MMKARKRGARASHARCLASRRTHLRPLSRRAQQGSAARDAPRHDRDGRAPQASPSQSQSKWIKPMPQVSIPCVPSSPEYATAQSAVPSLGQSQSKCVKPVHFVNMPAIFYKYFNMNYLSLNAHKPSPPAVAVAAEAGQAQSK